MELASWTLHRMLWQIHFFLFFLQYTLNQEIGQVHIKKMVWQMHVLKISVVVCSESRNSTLWHAHRCSCQNSNLQPFDHKSGALTTELSLLNTTGQSWYAELSHQSWAALILKHWSLLIPSGTVWLAVCSGQHDLIGCLLRMARSDWLSAHLYWQDGTMAQSDWLFAQEGKNLISCFLTGTDRWEEPAIFLFIFLVFQTPKLVSKQRSKVRPSAYKFTN